MEWSEKMGNSGNISEAEAAGGTEGVMEDLNDNQNCETLDPEQERLGLLAFKAFSVQEIFRLTLDNLRVSDILNCCLVSRAWHREGRSFLREKKICSARVQGHETCKSLQELDELLDNSESIPFNGLVIRSNMYLRRARPCLESRDILTLYPNLTLLRIKHLQIDWYEFPDCPVWSLIKHILETQPLNSLSVFSPVIFSSLICRFQLDVSRREWLWSLNKLTLLFPTGSNFYPLMEELLDAAPNLKGLYGTMSPEKLEYLIAVKAASKVREFRYCPFPGHMEMCAEFLLERPQLRKLYICSDTYWNLGGCLFVYAMVLQEMIEKCCYFLEEIVADQKHLDMFISCAQSGAAKLGLTDCTSFFPRLRSVELQSDDDSTIIVASTLLGGTSMEHVRFSTVRKLILHKCFQLSCLQTIFPNVEELQLINLPLIDFYFEGLWEIYPSLTSLAFEYDQFSSDFDSLVCGLSTSELNELQRMDDSFLKDVNIVPSRPSLWNLPNLKHLRIKAVFGCRVNWDYRPFITRLSGWLTFSRVPGLRVEIVHNEDCGKDIPGLLDPAYPDLDRPKACSLTPMQNFVKLSPI